MNPVGRWIYKNPLSRSLANWSLNPHCGVDNISMHFASRWYRAVFKVMEGWLVSEKTYG